MLKVGLIKKDNQIVGFQSTRYEFHKEREHRQRLTKEQMSRSREQLDYYLDRWQRWAFTGGGYGNSSLSRLEKIEGGIKNNLPLGVELPRESQIIIEGLNKLNNGTKSQRHYAYIIRAFYSEQRANEPIYKTLERIGEDLKSQHLRTAKDALMLVIYNKHLTF